MHDPLVNGIGLGLTRSAATSALPGAPVVAHRDRLVRGRATLAAGLHRLAGWVEPRPHPAMAC